MRLMTRTHSFSTDIYDNNSHSLHNNINTYTLYERYHEIYSNEMNMGTIVRYVDASCVHFVIVIFFSLSFVVRLFSFCQPSLSVVDVVTKPSFFIIF